MYLKQINMDSTSVSEKAKSLDLRAGKAKNEDIFSVFMSVWCTKGRFPFIVASTDFSTKTSALIMQPLPLKTTTESKCAILSLSSIYQSLEVVHVLMSIKLCLSLLLFCLTMCWKQDCLKRITFVEKWQSISLICLLQLYEFYNRGRNSSRENILRWSTSWIPSLLLKCCPRLLWKNHANFAFPWKRFGIDMYLRKIPQWRRGVKTWFRGTWLFSTEQTLCFSLSTPQAEKHIKRKCYNVELKCF